MKVEFTEEEQKMLKELFKGKNQFQDIPDIQPEDFCKCCVHSKECKGDKLLCNYINLLDAMFLEDEVIHKVTFQGNLKKLLNEMAVKMHSWSAATGVLEEYLHFNYTDIIGIGYNKELDTTTIQYYEF